MNLKIHETYLCTKKVWYIDDFNTNPVNIPLAKSLKLSTSNLKLASQMKILTSNFIDIMKTQFNAFTFGDLNSLYFKTKDDAEKALDWIESTIIAYKLSKGCN